VPLVHLPVWAILCLNVLGCVAVQFVAGYYVHRIPATRLQRDGRVLRIRRWERGGTAYVRWLRIRRWKDRVPEAGAVFAGGMSKRHLPTSDRVGLERFAAETRRAERSHWLGLVIAPLSAVWNPPLGVALMFVYAVVANVPCIAIQRYNRARVSRALERSRGSTGGSASGSGATSRRSGNSMP